MKQLSAESGVKRQTLSAWMGNRTQPDLESLDAIAKVLEVRTFEIVAAMDGDVAVSLTDPQVEEHLTALIARLLDERDDRRPPRRPS